MPSRPIAAVFLFAFVLAVYAPVLHHDFVNYDDDLYVTENSTVRQGLTPAGLRWALGTTHASNWHPLTWISHMLDVELYGLDPAGHHLTSAMLHALNAALLFLALRSLTGAPWPALFAALLFAVHPLRVESVAWVAERKDVLSGTFFMLTLLAHGAWVRAPSTARRLGLLACLALGLAAKPMLVTVPVVLLLLDGWPLRRCPAVTPLRLVREKAPLLLLAAGSAVATVLAQRTGGALQSSEAWPAGQRVLNALVSCVRYLGKTLWPVDLACFYPMRPIAAAEALGAGLLLAALTACAVLARRGRYATVGWLWYLVSLVPVIGLVQVGSQALADRYTYLPSIGLALAVAWLLADSGARRPRAAGVLAALLVALLTLATRAQLAHWQDGRTLFEHAIAVTPDNYVAHNNLGSLLMDAGDLAGAAAEFEAALTARPSFAPAYNNLGLAEVRRGESLRALGHFERAVSLDPADAEARSNLGALLQRQGRLDEGLAQLQAAVRLDPDHGRAHSNLGAAYEARGDLRRAAEEYAAALDLEPGLAEGHSNLGNVLLKQGDATGAAERYRTALALRPDFAVAHNNLAFVLAGQGAVREAAVHYRRALELDPGLNQAATGLAWLLATSADPTVREGREALHWAERCARATGHADPACLEALAAARAEIGDFPEAVRWQSRALELVPARDAALLRARLEGYRAGRAWRDR